MIPLILVLAVLFWILRSFIKYWYYGRIKIDYKYKLDKKVLDEILRPSEQVLEKMKAREKRIKDEAKVCKSVDDDMFNSEGTDDCTAKTQKKQRPLTIFEEMDLLQQEGKQTRRNPSGSRFVPGMFDDPLSRLYRDMQELKKNS